jgi:hypothetical protein
MFRHWKVRNLDEEVWMESYRGRSRGPRAQLEGSQISEAGGPSISGDYVDR